MEKFTVVLPSGWHMISLTGDVPAQVRRFVTRRLRDAPERQAVLVRSTLTKSVSEVATTLADGGAVALALAVEASDGLTGSPSTVFMPLTVPDGQDPLDALLAVASTDPSAKAVDVGALVAIRISSTDDATQAVAAGLDQAAVITGSEVGPQATTLTAHRHRVRYLMGEPGHRDRWIDVAFSVTSTSLPGSDEIAEAVIELFDASIQSFRWVS